MGTTQSKFATNITMSLEGLKMAVLKQVHSEAGERNYSLPPLHEFTFCGNVHFLDSVGNDVEVDRVIITFG